MTTYQDNKPTYTPQSSGAVKCINCAPAGVTKPGSGPAPVFPAPNTPIGR